MSETGFHHSMNIAVFGLGLMGGSFALAIHPYCQGVYGFDPDPVASTEAWRSGIFKVVDHEPKPWISQVDYIVLAAPVKGILDLICRLPGWHSGEVMVIDLGSTKETITEAMQALPERFDPLGGHPMCGKETSSFKNADAGLFKGHPFILTPLQRTSKQMLQVTEDVIDSIGAHPIYLDASTHDLWVSATSHVPHIIANCLAATTPVEAAPLVGPGFRSTTRLAASSSKIMLDILQTNRVNILNQIGLYERQLSKIKQLLENQDYPDLEAALKKGAKQYDDLLRQ